MPRGFILGWLAVAVLFGACVAPGVRPSPSVVAPTAAPTASPTANATVPALDPLSGLPNVAVGELPPEAAQTLALIDAAGPFPYDQDGAVFQNRESILPAQPPGYYHEYTVETPGSSDRGARRIVSGHDGELYWTDDHYDSFSRIVR